MTIRQKFKSSIRRGTGEAYLILKGNPALDFSDDIIKACLTNFAYDGQAEGSRADYLFDLIKLSRQKDKIRNAILKGLSKEEKDTWALVQLFDLATLFAKEGDAGAKQAVYNRFFSNPIEGSDWCGYDSILELDGLTGLKNIAITIGKFLKENPDDWQDDMIIRYFQDKNPKIKAMQELIEAAKTDPYIKVYLDNIKRTEAQREEHKRPIFNYEMLQERIKNSTYVFIPPAFTKSLTKPQIKKLADELLIEKNNQRKGRYLSIFSRIKFPYNYKHLLKLAKQKPNNNDRIAEWAVEALRFFKGNDIRKFAIKKIKSSKSPDTYTNLLINNYKKGDAKLLKKLANKHKSEHIVENLASSFVDIYEVNNTKECKEPLLTIYSKLNCGLHRNYLLKILIKNKVLPDNIRQEIKHDSNEDTRKLTKR